MLARTHTCIGFEEEGEEEGILFVSAIRPSPKNESSLDSLSPRFSLPSLLLCL
jgi:hypothetical protein